MAEKFLANFDQTWKMEALTQALRSQGVEPRVRRKAREYVSIITGMGTASYDVFVEEAEFLRALQVVQALPSAEEAGVPVTTPKNYFRRVVVFSLLGTMIVPLLFNIVATVNYREMRKHPISSGRFVFATVVLILGWLVAALFVLFFLRGERFL